MNPKKVHDELKPYLEKTKPEIRALIEKNLADPIDGPTWANHYYNVIKGATHNC